MKKVLFSLFLILFANLVLAQAPGPVIGNAVAIPAGSFACTQAPFPSPIGINTENPVTFCFSYYNLGFFNLSYLLISGLCGPFPLYNSLSFTIGDSAYTQTLLTGTIVPTSTNATITSLPANTWYTICYTWLPNCAQFSACPLIYSTALPIDLLYFDGKYNNDLQAVELQWATGTEKNVESYLIHKSEDLINFELVTEIDAKGNSTTTTVYEAYDYGKLNNIVYYRLTENTIDGQQIPHSIVAVSNKLQEENISQIYDVTGRQLTQLFPGVNVVKQGNAYFKVVKLK